MRDRRQFRRRSTATTAVCIHVSTATEDRYTDVASAPASYVGERDQGQILATMGNELNVFVFKASRARRPSLSILHWRQHVGDPTAVIARSKTKRSPAVPPLPPARILTDLACENPPLVPGCVAPSVGQPGKPAAAVYWSPYTLIRTGSTQVSTELEPWLRQAV